MKYDFTTLPDRHGRDSIAVDVLGKGFAPDAPQPGFDAIPMWVADMNFVCLPTIQQAVIERVQHPAFGYFDPTPEYYGSIIRWQETRNDVTGLTAEAIGYENGVLGGVISALNCVCSRGDKVLVHSPTYIGFTRCLTDNGYDIVHSPLVQDENGVWRMDYADMEKHLAEEHIHAAILCSPHNPCGRVWERWELEKAMELYKKYNVYVVSDEIWSDIILSGHKHIPTQSISADARMRTAALYAPSKTFNLAGLIGSYHIVYDPWWRDRIKKESSLCHYNSMNVLSMHALIGAYRPEGYEWADELCETLTGNVDFACDYIAKHFEGVHVTKPEGTYMLFVDCTDWCAAHGKTIQDVEKACWAVGAAVQDGVTLYSDQVKVQVSMDSGRVVGAECSQYLANHTRRTDIVPTVDVLQAREMVSGRLSVKSERLCVIPQDEDETLCWGFECTDGAADYWVFVNAKTREIEQILRVITTNQGEAAL